MENNENNKKKMKDYFVPKILPCPGECFLTTDSQLHYLYAVSIQHCEEGSKREEEGGLGGP